MQRYDDNFPCCGCGAPKVTMMRVLLGDLGILMSADDPRGPGGFSSALDQALARAPVTVKEESGNIQLLSMRFERIYNCFACSVQLPANLHIERACLTWNILKLYSIHVCISRL